MYSLHQHVCSNEHFLVRIVHHGTVIAYAVDGRSVFVFISFGEMVDETKLTQLCYIQFFTLNFEC